MEKHPSAEPSREYSVANLDGTLPAILKPGSKIRPQLEESDAIKLAERLYGITTSKISELVSYVDRNFKIHADT